GTAIFVTATDEIRAIGTASKGGGVKGTAASETSRADLRRDQRVFDAGPCRSFCRAAGSNSRGRRASSTQADDSLCPSRCGIQDLFVQVGRWITGDRDMIDLIDGNAGCFEAVLN